MNVIEAKNTILLPRACQISILANAGYNGLTIQLSHKAWSVYAAGINKFLQNFGLET